MSEATTYLELRDLRVSYGKVEALHGISVHVEQGEIVTILGANGAGKSHHAHDHQRAEETERRKHPFSGQAPAHHTEP